MKYVQNRIHQKLLFVAYSFSLHSTVGVFDVSFLYLNWQNSMFEKINRKLPETKIKFFHLFKIQLFICVNIASSVIPVFIHPHCIISDKNLKATEKNSFNLTLPPKKLSENFFFAPVKWKIKNFPTSETPDLSGIINQTKKNFFFSKKYKNSFALHPKKIRKK